MSALAQQQDRHGLGMHELNDIWSGRRTAHVDPRLALSWFPVRPPMPSTSRRRRMAFLGPAETSAWTSPSLSPSVRAGSRKSQGPNLSMSGSNQHLMRINLRRMELSVFIEVPSTNRSKGGDRAARKAP